MARDVCVEQRRGKKHGRRSSVASSFEGSVVGPRVAEEDREDGETAEDLRGLDCGVIGEGVQEEERGGFGGLDSGFDYFMEIFQFSQY
jgi:hypothetical protein